MHRLALPFLWLSAASVFSADALPSARPVPAVQAIPQPHGRTSFQWQGQELTALHFNPQDMRPFWYPVHTSHAPSLVRMGHPHDPHGHSHHNGVWVSHNSLNGLDFWGDRAKNQGRIVTVEVSREGYEDSDELAAMRMTNHWLKEEDRSLQLIEIRRTEIRPINGSSSWFMVVDMQFTAPKDKTAIFGATGFGLVAVRVAKSMGVHDGGGRLLNSEGQVNEKAMFRLPARWVDYSGRLTNEDDGFAGITLFNHPANPHNPTAFHVRDDGWMGACLSLETPLEVAEDKPLRVRYGLWVHEGAPDKEAIESHWQQFTALPLADMAQPKPKPAAR